MPEPTAPISEPTAPASPRAMTLNLWAQHGDWPARRAALRAGLRGAAA